MPIDYPAGFERTPPSERDRKHSYQASFGQTTKEIADEMRRLDPERWRAETASGGAYTKSNGLPKASANPGDPAFVMRWTKDNRDYAVACDAYSKLFENMRTVYLWIRETRLRGDRPVETGQDEFATARLPPADEAGAGDPVVAPGRTALTRATAAEILEVDPDASDAVVKAAYREQMKAEHPDGGGQSRDVAQLQDARDKLLGGNHA